MIALIGNIGFTETIVIVVLALLIFGDRLPQVATKAYVEFRKLRRTLDELRRETGIDRELRDLRRSVEDAANRARVEDPLRDIPTAAFRVRPAEGAVEGPKSPYGPGATQAPPASLPGGAGSQGSPAAGEEGAGSGALAPSAPSADPGAGVEPSAEEPADEGGPDPAAADRAAPPAGEERPREP